MKFMHEIKNYTNTNIWNAIDSNHYVSIDFWPNTEYTFSIGLSKYNSQYKILMKFFFRGQSHALVSIEFFDGTTLMWMQERGTILQQIQTILSHFKVHFCVRQRKNISSNKLHVT